jgi:hypothetical protein
MPLAERDVSLRLAALQHTRVRVKRDKIRPGGAIPTGRERLQVVALPEPDHVLGSGVLQDEPIKD